MNELGAPRDELRPRDRIARHFHSRPYATVVLAGGYEEAGEAGRWSVGPGDVLLHGPFSAHWNRVPPSGARVLNLLLPGTVRASAAMRLADPDLLVRLGESDPQSASEMLMQSCTPGPASAGDLPDMLAGLLSVPHACGVDDWSGEHQVSRQTAFRWFRDAYGVGPARYRVEARARRAWRLIVGSNESMVDVAAAAGFADQAHMCRDVKALTGCTPKAWRSSVLQRSFKTGCG
jgi:AraC-like DNA-binding protein